MSRDDGDRDLAALLRLLAPSGSGGGRRIMMIGATAGLGVSGLARRLAVEAGEHATRGAWLFDLDLMSNGQYEAACAIPSLAPGRPLDASLGAPAFFRLVDAQGKAVPPRNKHMLTLHRMGASRGFVSRFRAEEVPPGTRVQVAAQPAYWAAASSATDAIVVDAPPLERSRAGLALVAQMTGVVIVVAGDKGDAEDALHLRSEIERRGGRALGVVLARASQTARAAARWFA